MSTRHLALFLGFFGLSVAPAIIEPHATVETGKSLTPLVDRRVPEEARRALKDGRYFLASRLLHEHLTSSADSSAEALLLTAQADAGWQNWRSVRALLDGRSWLDSEGEIGRA